MDNLIYQGLCTSGLEGNQDLVVMFMQAASGKATRLPDFLCKVLHQPKHGGTQHGDWQNELEMSHCVQSHPNIAGLLGVVVAEEGDSCPVGLIFELHGMALSEVIEKVR
jgi:hypothetical protein